MVKRSKGKSIRGAKWFGQEQMFSKTRGKPAECDSTRGIKSIIPKENVDIHGNTDKELGRANSVVAVRQSSGHHGVETSMQHRNFLSCRARASQ